MQRQFRALIEDKARKTKQNKKKKKGIEFTREID